MYRDSGPTRTLVAVGATLAVAAALGTSSASAKPAPQLTKGAQVSATALNAFSAKAADRQGDPGRTAAMLPKEGKYAFLVKLSTRSTGRAFTIRRSSAGVASAKAAARAQLGTVTRAQDSVIHELPSHSRVLYRLHAGLAGVGVLTDVRNFDALRHLGGVEAVYPIAPKKPSNSYAVPLQGAPKAWTAYGDLGADSTVAIIDTGVDYTHADFGGEGTVAAYKDASANEGRDDADFPGDKVIGGYDLAGDTYDADPTSDTYNPDPTPDSYPLDCEGHGSHVAGTVAGLGENADGSTYTGDYNTSTPFDTMKIGPGMAPKAKLYAYRVFGCTGSTDLVADAIDMAMDPNGDGDTSDHVDVANLSLGSDFASPDDGDAVAVDAAEKAGITMVIASGNAGDLFDAGGSPGNVSSALTVAASTDDSAQLDSLNMTSPAGQYGAERSIAYDWADKADLSGDVARVEQEGNTDGCDPLDSADTAAVTGKIAFVEWTDDDAARRCGSAGRGANLAAAGAIGFIYADDQESFAAGITGDATIPGVLVTKSGGDAIRDALVSGTTVTVGSTTQAGFRQILDGHNDMVASFSSRGIGDAGNVKPDLTAVGESVFSAGSGTGTAGDNESGTSMATPMVAGAAALVRSAHKGWSPEQIKADLMNTATQDLYTGQNHTGTRFAPQRVGSGRIDVKAAVDNGVLAYNAEDHGAVSVSFGQIEATKPMTLTKTIKVENTTVDRLTYDIGYDARTSIPGAEFSVSPSSVTLSPRASEFVTVTLGVDPTKLTKTHDPTLDLTQAGIPRVFQSDVSGLVELTPTDAGSVLRVPVYAAPRPASTMTQPTSIQLAGGATQSALLPLTGGAVNQGSDDTSTQSLVAGFELQGTSGPAPECSDAVTTACVNFPSERSADLKYVGVTSDAPQLVANGQDPASDGMLYFAISTQGPWRTASDTQEFDIYIDSDGDGVPDAVAYNTRFSGTDIMVSELVDLNTGEVIDDEAINAALGDTDTALLNSDTMVMPVAIGALPGFDPVHSRISYGIASYSPYQNGPIEVMGMDTDGNLASPMSVDALNPGVTLAGTYTGDQSSVLFPDAPSSVLKLTRDTAAYAQDKGMGAMIVHFQNAVGDKAQILKLAVAPSPVNLSVRPTSVARGAKVIATVTVPTGSGPGATGAVTLKQGSTKVATGTLKDGTATLSFTASQAGRSTVVARYAGDDSYAAGTSNAVDLTVARTKAKASLWISPKSFKHGKKATAAVTIKEVAGVAATGKVKLKAGKKVLAKGKLVAGKVKLRFTSKKQGKLKVIATYAGDRNYTSAKSRTVKVKVR